MALPKTGITASLVGNILGTSARNVGALAINANVNMWSKHKPFRNNSTAFKTETEWLNAIKNTNYAMVIPSYTISNVTDNTISNWTYSKPRGATYNEPYRLGDFRLYNHNATPPLTFCFSNGETEYMYNSLLNNKMPYIYVNAKVSDTQSSNFVSNADITLGDVNVDGITTANIANYLGCVTNGTYVCNTEDTLNCKFGTSINGNVIDLSKYTISSMFTTDSDKSKYPSGATNCQKIILYPRINKFIPSTLGQVRSNGGVPTTNTGLNGYYTPTSYPFIAVPQATALTVRRYSWNPLKVNYLYANVIENATTFASMWIYVENSASYTATTQNLGKKTLRFADTQVILNLAINVTNENSTPTSIRLTSVQGSIFPAATVSMYVGTTATTGTAVTSTTIPANTTITIAVKATYSAGSRGNFTFPSMTSPSYGTEKPIIRMQMSINNSAYGAAFIPNETTTKQLRWR